MMRVVVLNMRINLVFLALAAIPVLAKDIYVAQNAVGGNTGANCANARPVSWANTTANWGSGTEQIGPGTVVHLCGTFTAAANTSVLETRGNGTAGNPITILAEPGAVLTSPAWHVNGALFCNSHSYIVFDGGSNGVIRATANGDSLANQRGMSSGIGTPLRGCDNYTVRNWSISNIYVKVEGSPINADDSTGIVALGSNVSVSNNTIDHAATGIAVGYCGMSHLDIFRNRITFSNHHIASGASGMRCAMDDVRIHQNDIGTGAYIYDNVKNDYHHNGIQVFADSSNGPNPTITNLKIYNNYVHGVFSRDSTYGGSHTTSWIFVNDGQGSGTIPNIQIFNNILVQENGDLYGPANGYISGVKAGGLIYNNTIVGDNNQSAGCISVADFPTTRVMNNVMQKCGYAVVLSSGYGQGAVVNNNLYHDLYSGGQWAFDNSFFNFADWQKRGYDAQGINNADPRLDAAFKPQPGSAAFLKGANLSNLGFPELNVDIAGVARPAAGAWTMGAYQVSGSTVALEPPSRFNAAVRPAGQ